VTTIRVGGVRFRFYPRDHEPAHAHARYAEIVVIVEFQSDGAVRISDRFDAMTPSNASRSDVRKILKAAAEAYDTLLAAWEHMHEE
jgi:hypothetical protein